MTPMEAPTQYVRSLIRDAVKKSGMGLRRFEKAHNLKPWTLHGLLDPARKQKPSLDRAAEICRALGLEFYIGPPRDDGVVPRKDEVPVAVEITQLLDLPRDATVEAAVKAIEMLIAAGGDGADVLRENMAGAIKAETEALRLEIAGMAARLDMVSYSDNGVLPRIREPDLIVPTLMFLAKQPDGAASTSDIIAYIEKRFRPAGENTHTLEGSGNLWFSQTVRNMISHRKDASNFIRNGYAEYLGAQHGVRITNKGRRLLKALVTEG